MKAKDIYAIILNRGDNYLDVIAEHTDSFRVAFRVLAMHSGAQSKLFPFINVHARCVRRCRKLECQSVSELVACYTAMASKIVNNSKNW